MVIYENDEHERLAQADRLFRKKVTALGALGNILEEPFFDFRTLPETQIMNKQPTADTNFIAPDYEDFNIEDGAVGTRFGVTTGGALDPVRLHSYLPSGLSGAASCQTFFTIKPFEPNPVSHDIFELENKRMYPIIGPEFSPRRIHAAETDVTKRGFEIALFPARSSGGVGTPLVADDSYGPIPSGTDPGAVRGADDGGYWYCDYDNGMIRLSRPMLHGEDGVFNPNNVYGDIDGNEIAEGGSTGAPQLFAVFYRYTGDFGIDNRTFITIGDGYVSTGLFNGVGANTIQAAIDSLPDVGGTVFIKEGTYDYINPVRVRGGIRIIGLSGVKITRPRTEPAFAINNETRGVVDGYQTIEGVEIYPRDGVNSGGAIELQSSSASQEIRRVVLRNNMLFAENDAPAITFGPSDNCTYLGLKIEGNIFKPASANPVYISYRDRGGNVDAPGMQLINNDFQLGDTSASTALLFDGTVLTDISGMVIDNNNMEYSDISLSVGAGTADGFTLTDTKARAFTLGNDANNVVITNNIFSATVSMRDLTDSTFSNNHTGAVDFDVLTNSQFTNNNTSEGIIGEDITNSTFSNNNLGSVTLSGDITSSSFTANDVNSVSCDEVDDSSLTNNNISGSLTLSGDTEDSKFVSNTITGAFTANGNTRAVVSDNVVGTDISLGSTNDIRLVRNEVGDDIVLTGTINDSIIESNIVADDMSLSALVTSTVVGNFIGDDITMTTVTSSAVRDNKCDNISMTTVLNSNLNNNIVTGNFGITGTVDDSNINDNIGDSTLAVTGKVTNSNFRSNHFASAGVANSVAGTALEASFFENNVLSGGGLAIGSGSGANGDLISSYVVGNAVSGTITMDDATSSVISSNIARNSGGTVFDITVGDLQSAVYTNNIGSIFNTGTINDSVVDKNIGTGACNVGGVIDTSKFADNTFSSAIISGNVTNSTLSGNDLGASGLAITGYFRDSMFIGNNMSGTFSVTVDVINSIFSANRMLSATLVSLTNTIINANEIGGTLNASSGGTTGVILAENRFTSTSTTHLLGVVTDSIINNNIVDDNITITSLDTSLFSGNDIAGNFVSSAGFTDSTFDGNRIEGTSSSIGGLTDSFFTDNALPGTSAISVGAVSGSFVTGNGLGTGGAGDLAATTFRESVFSGNALADVQFSELGNNAAPGEGSVFDDNIVVNFTVSGTITDSIISNSVINGDATLNGSLAGNNTLNRSVFDGNIIRGSFTCGDRLFYDSSICNNYFENGPEFHGMEGCVVTGNRMLTTTSFAIGAGNTAADVTVLSSVIDGNVFADLEISTASPAGAVACMQGSVFSNNAIGDLDIFTSGSTTIPVLLATIFSGNRIVSDLDITGNSVVGVLQNSIVTDNHIGVNLTIDNDIIADNGDILELSELSNNTVIGVIRLGDGLTSSGSGRVLFESKFDGNTAEYVILASTGRNKSTTTYLNSSISGNRVGRDLDINGEFEGGVFSSNIISIEASAGDEFTADQFNSSSVTNNYFKGDATFLQDVGGQPVFNGCAVENNIFAEEFRAQNTTSSGTTSFVLSDTVFQGNIFGDIATFQTTNSSNSSPVFSNSILSDNGFAGALNVTSASDSALDYSIIKNNVVSAGDINIDGQINRAQIINNETVNGNLDISSDDLSTANYSSISGNVVTGDFLITRDSTSGGEVYIMTGTMISDNIVDGSVQWEQLAASTSQTGGVMRDCIVANNKVQDKTTNTWRIAGGHSGGGVSVCLQTVFDANCMAGDYWEVVDKSDNTAGKAFNQVVFANNFLECDFNLATDSTNNASQHAALNSNFIGNYFYGDFVAFNSGNTNVSTSSGVEETSFIGNVFGYNGVSGQIWNVYGGLVNCNISSNLCLNNVNWGNVGESVITNNIFSLGVDWVDFSDTQNGVYFNDNIIDGNYFGIDVDIGAESNTKTNGNVDVLRNQIVNNHFEESLYLVDDGGSGINAGDICEDCIIANNYFAGGGIEAAEFTPSGMNNVIIANNIMQQGRIRIKANLGRCIITGNSVHGSSTEGQLRVNGNVSNCIITDNYIEENFNISGYTISDSVISDNNVLGTFSSFTNGGGNQLSANRAGTNNSSLSITGHFEAIGEPAIEAIGSTLEYAIEASAGTGQDVIHSEATGAGDAIVAISSGSSGSNAIYAEAGSQGRALSLLGVSGTSSAAYINTTDSRALEIETSGGTGVSVSVGDASAVVLDNNDSSNPTLMLTNNSVTGGEVLQITSVDALGIGVDINNSSGTGVSIDVDNGTGLYINGGDSTAVDIDLSSGTGIDINMTSAGAVGLNITAAFSQSVSGINVSLDQGVACFLNSDDDYCLVVSGDTSSPETAPMRIVPTGTPVGKAVGDMYVNTSGILFIFNGSGWVKVGSQ